MQKQLMLPLKRRLLEELAELVGECPSMRTVVFNGHVRHDLIAQLMEAGAWGYIANNDGEQALMDALRSVVAGDIAFSPEAGGYYYQ